MKYNFVPFMHDQLKLQMTLAPGSMGIITEIVVIL